MSGNVAVKVSQGYEVLRPKSDKALPIPCNEWDVLKNQISALTTEPWLFHTLGSLLLGASLASVISIWTGAINVSNSATLVIAWAVVTVCAISGGLSLYFAHKERGVYRARAQSVVTQMGLIESRFEREGF